MKNRIVPTLLVTGWQGTSRSVAFYSDFQIQLVFADLGISRVWPVSFSKTATARRGKAEKPAATVPFRPPDGRSFTYIFSAWLGVTCLPYILNRMPVSRPAGKRGADDTPAY